MRPPEAVIEAVFPTLLRPRRPRLGDVLRDLSDARWSTGALQRALDPDDPDGAAVRADLADWLDAQAPERLWDRVVERDHVPRALLASRAFVWVSDTAEVSSGNLMHCAAWSSAAPDPGLAVSLAADWERIADLDAQLRAACWPLLAASVPVELSTMQSALAPVSVVGRRHSAGVGCRHRCRVTPEQVMPWRGATRATLRRRWIEHRKWLDAHLRARTLAEHHADVSMPLANYLLASDMEPLFAEAVANGDTPPGPDPTRAYRAVMDAGYWILDAWANHVFLAVPDPVPWSVEHWPIR